MYKSLIHKTADLNDRDFLVHNLHKKTYQLKLLLNCACSFMFYVLRSYMLYCSYFWQIISLFVNFPSFVCL